MNTTATTAAFKTAKSTTLLNLLAKWPGQKGTIAYQSVKAYLEGTPNWHYDKDAKGFAPVYSSGLRRNTTNHDKSDEYRQILAFCRIGFEETNIAPRGGACGLRFLITTKIR